MEQEVPKIFTLHYIIQSGQFAHGVNSFIVI